jgi:hypothetical protein
MYARGLALGLAEFQLADHVVLVCESLWHTDRLDLVSRAARSAPRDGRGGTLAFSSGGRDAVVLNSTVVVVVVVVVALNLFLKRRRAKEADRRARVLKGRVNHRANS